MRPRLKPALRPAWRGDGVLQLGVDPHRAVVLAGVDRARARLIERLDGSLDERGVHREAARLGLTAGETDQLLALLLREGVVEDATAGSAALLRLPLLERDRLAPDLAALSVAHATRDGARGVLARRQRAAVVVHGAGRVGAPLAALLAAAGVGRVTAEDEGEVRPSDLAPGGHAPEALGRPRRSAAADLVRAAAATARTGSVRRGTADVVVLAGETPADPVLLAELVRAGVVHLVVELREGSAVVGPLVLPGRSSCRRCHDLTRSERDPAWPRVAAQHQGRTPVAALDVALAAQVSATAALQVLAHLDGAPPPTVDGTLELMLPGGRVRRRGWPRHPACGCGWAETPG